MLVARNEGKRGKKAEGMVKSRGEARRGNKGARVVWIGGREARAANLEAGALEGKSWLKGEGAGENLEVRQQRRGAVWIGGKEPRAANLERVLWRVKAG